MNGPAVPRADFGIATSSTPGIEHPELEEQFARKSMKPKELQDMVHKLYDMVEEMQITTRDNNAILCQMLFSVEERINKRIDDVKAELLDMILSGGAKNGRRITAGEVNARLDRYKSTGTTDGGDGHDGRKNQPMYEMVEISPMPGFVIKTKKLLGEKEKVFINVFHHEYIELEPSEETKGAAREKPFMVMTQASSTVDKEGQTCLMFNLGVSSEYFRQPNTKVDINITAPTTIHKIIHKVNMKFNEFLDEGNYSLPRLANGYKGSELPKFSVPVLIKHERPNSRASSDPAEEVGPFRGISKRQSDDHSIVSDISYDATHNNNASVGPRRGSRTSLLPSGVTPSAHGKKALHRKSFFDQTAMGYNGGDIAGRNLLSGDMLDYIPEENVDNATAESIKKQSVEDPVVLLGWQIWVQEEGKGNTIYVVTDVRKNYLSKSEFRVSRFQAEDAWVKLKRAGGKNGLEFRCMRKVLFGLQVEDESNIGEAN